jgi:PAS domain S-box-containing protein
LVVAELLHDRDREAEHRVPLLEAVEATQLPFDRVHPASPLLASVWQILPGKHLGATWPLGAARAPSGEAARGDRGGGSPIHPNTPPRQLPDMVEGWSYCAHMIDPDDQNEAWRGELQKLLLAAVHSWTIITLDAGGRIESWNAAAQELKGWSAEEIIGRHVSVLYAPEDVAAGKVERLLEQARNNGTVEDEAWRVRKDGTRFWANVVITALFDDRGELRGYGKLTRDMTERRQLELELVEARAAAEAARQVAEDARAAAEEANRAKDHFLSTVSHELRTPLNAVIGFAQLLALESLTASQRDAVTHIEKAGRHLLDLINEVLDISRISARSLSLSPEAVSVSDAVSDAATMLKAAAQARAVDVQIASDGPEHVLADRQRIKQILLNLISNAIKYNYQGGTVVVRWSQDQGRVRVEVSDTGAGIPAPLMTRLFAPFDRLHASSSDIEGTGLGLALSKGLAEAMGGTLSAESTVGEGSTFRLDLPSAQPPVADVETSLPGPVRLGVTGSRVQVLYIEDNLSNARLVERVVQHRPHVELVPAMQGRLGAELARELRPKLVLLDLHLPDASGEDVLHELQGHPATSAIPVVIMSADATRGRIQRLREAGAVQYLT